MNPSYRSAADLFPSWREDVLHGDPPTRWPCGDGELANIEIGPGLIVLLGGAPGSGKTALTMQIIVESLRRNTGLRALFASLEMAPSALLDRALARLSGLDATAIRRRDRDNLDARALEAGFSELAAIADRLAFIDDPSLPAIAEAADDFRADLLAVDYLQLVRSPGKHADRRAAIDDVLTHVRRFAAAGVGVLALSAVGRQKDAKGRSTYDADALSLSSFRESSGLEYTADSAYILAPTGDDGGMILKHVKNRHGECRDLHLRFDRKRQNFLDDLDAAAWADAAKPTADADDIRADIAAARERAKRAGLKVVKPADRFEGRKDLE